MGSAAWCACGGLRARGAAVLEVESGFLGTLSCWSARIQQGTKRGLLYILWKVDKLFIFKVHLVQLAGAIIFNILIEFTRHFL